MPGAIPLWKTRAGCPSRMRLLLLDVFPERGIELPGNDREQAQEQQDPDAHADARVVRRLAHPLQIADQIAHRLVVLQGGHGPRTDLLPAVEDLDLLAVFFLDFLEV